MKTAHTHTCFHVHHCGTKHTRRHPMLHRGHARRLSLLLATTGASTHGCVRRLGALPALRSTTPGASLLCHDAPEHTEPEGSAAAAATPPHPPLSSCSPQPVLLFSAHCNVSSCSLPTATCQAQGNRLRHR